MRQISIQVRIVEPVTNDEFVGNLERHVVRLDGNFDRLRLAAAVTRPSTQLRGAGR